MKSLTTDRSLPNALVEFFARANSEREMWMFAYDAWMIRPAFASRQHVPALVRGWRRSVSGQIEPDSELPLALVPNGSVHGMLLKFSDDDLKSDMIRTWSHWVDSKKHRPIWVTAKCSFGDIDAVTFVDSARKVDRPPLDVLLREGVEVSVVRDAAAKAKELNDILAMAGRADRYLHALGRALAATGIKGSVQTIARRALMENGK